MEEKGEEAKREEKEKEKEREQEKLTPRALMLGTEAAAEPPHSVSSPFRVRFALVSNTQTAMPLYSQAMPS